MIVPAASTASATRRSSCSPASRFCRGDRSTGTSWRDGRQCRRHHHQLGPPTRRPGRGQGGGLTCPHHVPQALVRARGHPRRPARLAGVLRHIDRRSHPGLADPRCGGPWTSGPSPTRPGCCAPGRLARLVIAETFALSNGRSRDGPWATWPPVGGWSRGTPCAASSCRPPAYRIRRAHPGVRRRLAGAAEIWRDPRAVVGGRTPGPTRHHVRGRLLHLAPRPRVRTVSSSRRGGGATAHRRAAASTGSLTGVA